MAEKKGFRFAYDLRQQADSKDEAEIMIYSQIVSRKWRQDDPEVTAKDFDKLLKDAKASGATKLRLRINSPGGDVRQAVAMKTMLDMSSFEEINVDIEGLCASAATLFVCVPNAHVRIAQGSEFMIHNPWVYTSGSAAELIKTAERLTKMENDQHEMFAGRSGKTAEQVKEWMDAETWFTAKEAVEYGFADEIMQTEQAAACVSEDEMGMMREMFRMVPKEIQTRARENTVSTAQKNCVSENKNTHKEGKENMDIKEITEQLLQAENPECYNAILEKGRAAERQRIEDIDALTDEGFEEMAQEAKHSGASAAEFLQKVVAARAQKKKDFLTGRKNETAPAQAVTGGSAEDNDQAKESEEIESNAKEIAELAKQASSGHNMF